MTPTLRRGVRLSAAAIAVVLSLSPGAARAVGLQDKDNVAITGDSITEQKLYSVFVEDYLLMCEPAAGLEAHQFGWSGESVPGLVNRMKFGVLPFKPTVATTCYGMNDGGYSAIDPARQQKYRDGTQTIVRTFKDAGVRLIVVGSPGAVDTDTFDKKANKKYPAADYNKTLADLSRIAKEVADAEGVAFADVLTPMSDVMAKAKAKYGPEYHLAGPDGIHPVANGHLVMAYAFLKALGVSGDVGTITYDAAAGSATATAGHKVLSAAGGSIELESTRYPFCFFGNPAEPNGTRGVLEFLPFNDELNRYTLVVKNAPGPQVKITWGTESKTFSADQVAKGINLAAEFLDNPFSEPFAKVEKAIRDQQTFETPAVKSILNSLPAWGKQLPDDQAALDAVRDAVLRRAGTLAAASKAAVEPVKHTIRIEAVR